MKLSVLAAAVAMAAPVAPVLAHCRTIHHRVHHAVHRSVHRIAARHRAVRYAACGCRHVVRHRAVYPIAYRPPEIVDVTYERPMPVYRPYRILYPVPLYRPRPIFYGGFERRHFHRWDRFGDYRPHRWGGFGGGHRHGWGGRR
jgi:hypothetical protein